MQTLFQDLRYAIRLLRKSFTIVAVLTLALGIGVNSAMITLFNALAPRPLPVNESERLVNVYRKLMDNPGVGNHLSYPEYAEYRDLNDVFLGLTAYVGATIPSGRMPVAETAPEDQSSASKEEQIFARLLSRNYFDVLRGRCAFGRSFLPEEAEIPGAQGDQSRSDGSFAL